MIPKNGTDTKETKSQGFEKEGLTLEKYQEVFAALQSDQSLQQKFNEMMQG